MKKSILFASRHDKQKKTGMMMAQKRYVRITSTDRPGFVEFHFSFDDPTLYLEMILPTEAFTEFCRSNQVTFLSDEDAETVAKQQEKWRYGETEGEDEKSGSLTH